MAEPGRATLGKPDGTIVSSCRLSGRSQPRSCWGATRRQSPNESRQGSARQPQPVCLVSEQAGRRCG
jgi:hypothetical protein